MLLFQECLIFRRGNKTQPRRCPTTSKLHCGRGLRLTLVCPTNLKETLCHNESVKFLLARVREKSETMDETNPQLSMAATVLWHRGGRGSCFPDGLALKTTHKKTQRKIVEKNVFKNQGKKKKQ